jgi:hypothetical protein
VRAGVIVDVEATSAHRNREVDATRTMIERTEQRFAMKPERLVGDMAYGAGPMLSWLVEAKQIEPHIPVWDKTERTDGTISSGEFLWDESADEYRCPLGRPLRREWRAYSNPRTHITKAETIIYRTRAADCAGTKPRVTSLVRWLRQVAIGDHAESARRSRYCSLTSSGS